MRVTVAIGAKSSRCILHKTEELVSHSKRYFEEAARIARELDHGVVDRIAE